MNGELRELTTETHMILEILPSLCVSAIIIIKLNLFRYQFNRLFNNYTTLACACTLPDTFAIRIFQ